MCIWVQLTRVNMVHKVSTSFCRVLGTTFTLFVVCFCADFNVGVVPCDARALFNEIPNPLCCGRCTCKLTCYEMPRKVLK